MCALTLTWGLRLVQLCAQGRLLGRRGLPLGRDPQVVQRAGLEVGGLQPRLHLLRPAGAPPPPPPPPPARPRPSRLLALPTPQQMIILAFASPAAAVMAAPDVPLNALDAVAFALTSLCILGEAVADEQMWQYQTEKYGRAAGEALGAARARLHRERAGRSAATRTTSARCRRGGRLPPLLRRRRHARRPRRLGELDDRRPALPHGPLRAAARVDDVTETLASSKYPACKEYQAAVSRIVPWFPGKAKAAAGNGKAVKKVGNTPPPKPTRSPRLKQTRPRARPPAARASDQPPDARYLRRVLSILIITTIPIYSRRPPGAAAAVTTTTSSWVSVDAQAVKVEAVRLAVGGLAAPLVDGANVEEERLPQRRREIVPLGVKVEGGSAARRLASAAGANCTSVRRDASSRRSHHAGTRASGWMSWRARLTSSTGVPSTTSAPPRSSVSPRTSSSRATLSPIGHGRCGVRVANRPQRPPSRPGGAPSRAPSAVASSRRWCSDGTRTAATRARMPRGPPAPPPASRRSRPSRAARARRRELAAAVCRAAPCSTIRAGRSAQIGCRWWQRRAFSAQAAAPPQCGPRAPRDAAGAPPSPRRARAAASWARRRRM